MSWLALAVSRGGRRWVAEFDDQLDRAPKYIMRSGIEYRVIMTMDAMHRSRADEWLRQPNAATLTLAESGA